MAISDGGGKKKKTVNRSHTKQQAGKLDTSEGTNTSGAKNQKDFSDMAHDEIVAIVVNTAVIAKGNLNGMVVANYSGNIPGIIIQIPGWHVVNGEVVATMSQEAQS